MYSRRLPDRKTMQFRMTDALVSFWILVPHWCCVQIEEISTHLHIFQAILLTDAPKHVLLAALLHLSR